jgi:hypothetical protein
MAMRERPILFNGEMVKAIIQGQKTQTRRVMKLRPGHGPVPLLPCPYGQPGDQLWVRETHQFVFHDEGKLDGAEYNLHSEYGDTFDIRYLSDPNVEWDWDGGWRPSIHMPKWASRITLEITDIRVERLQEISEEGAKNEGTETWAKATLTEGEQWENQRMNFAMLWESIHGEGTWGQNPWVWVVEFRRIK